jgi:hypothetical protein
MARQVALRIDQDSTADSCLVARYQRHLMRVLLCR